MQGSTIIFKNLIMKDIPFEIGTDVWAVSKSYRPALIRGHIKAIIQEHSEAGNRIFCRIKPLGKEALLDFEINEVFPVANRCHDALCRLDALRDTVFFSMS